MSKTGPLTQAATGFAVPNIFSKAQPPPPTDYAAAAAGQGSANIDMANQVSQLNRPDEFTPFGSKIWQNLGDNKWQVNTNLSPEQQQLFDQYLATQGVMGDAAGKVAGQLKDVIGQPLDLSGVGDNTKGTTDAIYNRYAQYLDPRFAKAEDAQRTDLVNRGFSVGNEGYSRQMGTFNDTKQKAYADAMDASISSGSEIANKERNQQISEILLQRAQPMQELMQLLQKSAPTMPTFQSNYTGATAGAAPVFAGAQAGAQYGMDIYNNNVSTQNAMLQGLFGLGAAYAGKK